MDMGRSLLLLPLFLSAPVLSAQECGTGRYTDYGHFPSIDSTLAVPFGHNTGVDGIDQTLRMDIYAPANDTLSMRPVVLVAFGGSFITGTREDVAPFCRELAHLGYVGVAMDYRVGLFFPNESTTMHAVMRCVHDMKGCIRYLRQTVAVDGNPYHIDPGRIIIGGVSAGAIGALHLTYMNLPSELPAVLAADSALYGGMEGTSGPPGYSSEVMACFSLSGAIGDTSWIQPGDQPLCAIHETGDPTVPCFTEEAYAFGYPTGITVSGGHDIHERMTHIGVPNCYLEYDSAQHVGYLLYDPINSVDMVVQFLARVVCGQAPGCPGTIYQGVEELTRNVNGLNPYPNPASGTVTIHMASAGTIVLTDLEGRDVLRRELPKGDGALDTSTLSDGLYLMHTVGTGPRRSERLIVAH
jgi:acetyl esterase/lipase